MFRLRNGVMFFCDTHGRHLRCPGDGSFEVVVTRRNSRADRKIRSDCETESRLRSPHPDQLSRFAKSARRLSLKCSRNDDIDFVSSCRKPLFDHMMCSDCETRSLSFRYRIGWLEAVGTAIRHAAFGHEAAWQARSSSECRKVLSGNGMRSDCETETGLSENEVILVFTKRAFRRNPAVACFGDVLFRFGPACRNIRIRKGMHSDCETDPGSWREIAERMMSCDSPEAVRSAQVMFNETDAFRLRNEF